MSLVKPASTRILLAYGNFHWRIHQGDVKTAFLNSNLDNPVYVTPPERYKVASLVLSTAHQGPL